MAIGANSLGKKDRVWLVGGCPRHASLRFLHRLWPLLGPCIQRAVSLGPGGKTQTLHGSWDLLDNLDRKVSSLRCRIFVNWSKRD